MSKDRWKERRMSGKGTTPPPTLQGWKELRKSGQGAVMAGVCHGLSKVSNLRPWIWRLLSLLGPGLCALGGVLKWSPVFILGLILSGLYTLAYLGLWAFLKYEEGTRPQITPLFRKIDWWTFAATTFLVLVGYLYTLAPDLTLEDSGELAVGSFYAGVPHPPGYPVWTLYTWFFTVILPFSNIAWRVAVSSAVAGALSSGLIALMASRGSSMILESIEELKNIDRRWENALCMVSGYVAGMLIGFNGFMWSQAVIVEVYTLSVLSLALVLCFLLRWIHTPEQKRYLYWALFLFGICLTNHQTLIVAAMGIEVAITVIRPRLGRDLWLLNSVIYLAGLILKANGMLDMYGTLFMIYNLIGIVSIAITVWLVVRTGGLGDQFWTGLCMGLFYILGASFYLYMPIASMTNPPMNWGYPRTWEGFLHALTRGQYESTNPTSDLGRFMNQMDMLLQGAVDEFNLVFLLVGVIVFFFLRRMQRREQAWILGLLASYLCLAVLLIVLLNPSNDRNSREMNRVFFTASHLMISLWVGYGLSIFGALILTQYQRYRQYALYGSAVATAIALYAVTVVFQTDRGSLMAQAGLFGVEPSHDSLVRFTSVFSLCLAVATVAIFAIARTRPPMIPLLVIMLVVPFKSVLSHWANNEQRGHLFGYWFGHDMFAPPFDEYGSMAKNAILFGGTDPGRFCPTYMIFCESFTPARCKPKDPEFDRRDVYIITQNALADGTYLNYIRAHYNRSTQIDPPFFQDMLRSREEFEMNRETNSIARLAIPLDRFFTKIGAWFEERRREQGIYPPDEIYTPSNADHARCMTAYFTDARRRLAEGRLKQGEIVGEGADGRIQVSGQVAVMAINALLTKVIFDQNPTNEFYVEESFPLDWMYPHLEPFGIIMRINREPLDRISEEKLARDHRFWRRYSKRLIGDWIDYDTSIEEICDWVRRTHIRHNYEGFTGDRKFLRDDQAQKAFSKLRSAIGGLYNWWIGNTVDQELRDRMTREANFALRQAFAFCPYSPEAVIRLTNLLALHQGRTSDALLIARTALLLDPTSETMMSLVAQLQQMAEGAVTLDQVEMRLQELEKEYLQQPTNVTAGLELVDIQLALQRTNAAVEILDRLLTQPTLDVQGVLKMATIYASMQMPLRLEMALKRLTELAPDSPEPWYDLASTQAIIGRQEQALASLRIALQLSDARLVRNPASYDIRPNARTNDALRRLPGFDALMNASRPAN